ncbi:MAG: hypothetical protein V2I67_16235 [Thermoanaerobaculales bacterium]|jgi:hypothetical protein|nr:hypothetical protein [Thermoanaerobaculales bacterium]
MASFTFDVRIEPERNVMYMTQSGRPSAGDFEQVHQEVMAAADRLKRGFILVNDQRRLEPFDEGAMVVAKGLIADIGRAGVSKVIRIVPSDLVSMTKILRALVTADSPYPTIRVSSSKQAEEILAGERSTDG